ncbi:hypothetical protein A9Q84_17800 [Halobacteriovorax marinus]|uniref:malate synthase n=1 Tax=Halobacteriovorax marinus TaxID=97084 RepID=A0A1Y5F9Q6_9BACT|nr:hypothetical protein A9Q84_17800 [Halobacteriovorax marinus]
MNSTKIEIPYYEDYISPALREHLLSLGKPYPGVEDLIEVDQGGGLENTESLNFLCELYDAIKGELNTVLNQRITDREFIDKRVKACYQFNEIAKNDFTTSKYKTILGLEDAKGRIVIGPFRKDYYNSNQKMVAPIPEFLKGNHVTLFGPPESAKLSINAMNAFHRALKDEPSVVGKLLETHESVPKWGADDEDSKTPLRKDLALAGQNLTECFDGTLKVVDSKKGKTYELKEDKLSLPIKRFPGLALPCTFLFYRGNPLPLHLYDFALHLFKNWHNPKALAFYVPKLENEEEARYIKNMMETSEKMIKALHPEYEMGTIRLLVVLENPRAVFRVNEMMDELYPYFAGASLGWHDYLGSTARLFKEDPNYRIPVKADPDIVINYIKGSHQLLADVVGPRGGIKIGGMYGILPITSDIHSESFQISIYGFIKDVVTQMKRSLDGFWVAHPDFMRIGLALVEGWKQKVTGKRDLFDELIKSLLQEKYHQEIFKFIDGEDIVGLDYEDELYDRSLIVADIKESTYIRNNDPIEVRYNVFQSLQYLTDWLSGNGCVALPAIIDGKAVRVMDDLATAERSRWEVWHEIYHGRFSKEEFFKIAHEEMHFIRKDLSNDIKIVQVKYNERTEKWYPIALKLMIKLMTDPKPVEFATELLMPFSIDSIREASDPWKELSKINPTKYSLDLYTERFNHFFEMCGSVKFATEMGKTTMTDFSNVDEIIMSFSKEDVIDGAYFHGNIGESKKTLDQMAMAEQAKVFSEDQKIADELLLLGAEYLSKFGIKFLVSAKGKSGSEMMEILKTRMENSFSMELENAKSALLEITKKRLLTHPIDTTSSKIENLLKESQIIGLSLSVTSGIDQIQAVSFGELQIDKKEVTENSLFEIASLSKTFASAFAIEFFKKRDISLATSVNELLAKTESTFRLKSSLGSPTSWGDKVTLRHLMSHGALNMHYVNGVPADKEMPSICDFLEGNSDYGYEKIVVINEPGEKFQYSGAGFIVLEHLIEALTKESIFELTDKFYQNLNLDGFTFKQTTLTKKDYAFGYLDTKSEVEGSRKMFPAFAAGAMASAKSVTTFLNHLTKAYNSPSGSSVISNHTAVSMLSGTDLGCQQFMGANMGLGVFIAEAGLNKLAIHQGANDGFRSLYVHCFKGPDLGKGFTLLCNADQSGVVFLSKVAQLLLSELRFSGIDFSKFIKQIDMKNVPSEELVNFGYKNLVFNSFMPTLPEEIVTKGAIDPLSKFNHLVDSKISHVTNEKFARAENLISAHLPIFDPEHFGEQGKIMDSWESARHNQIDADVLVLDLKEEMTPKFISISTKYHLGNQAPFVSVLGLCTKSYEWITVLERTSLAGHALKQIKLEEMTSRINKVKISIYPDGGLTRVGLYSDSLPADAASEFESVGDADDSTFVEEIPGTLKPMHLTFKTTEAAIKEQFSKLSAGEEYDVASAIYGGVVVSTTNEHYGPATQVNSPYPAISMFDGLESARSREIGHRDEVVISLGKTCSLKRIEFDFTFFVNNNPYEIETEGLIDGKWVTLTARENVKGYASMTRVMDLSESGLVEQIKVITYPDGGINRIRAISVN